MCCNAQGDCYPKQPTDVQSWGFLNYMQFTWFFILALFGIVVVIALVSTLADKCNNKKVLGEAIDRVDDIFLGDKDALELIGDDSVYQFILGNSILGWFACLSTYAAQMWMLLLFVEAAEIDLDEDVADLVYTWACPRDNAECRDTGDLTYKGWIAFGILMASHTLLDIIHGARLVALSGKTECSIWDRVRFFFGGTLVFILSVFTLYASVIYNMAIATSNTEIVMNSVVILFICDVDELNFDILVTINENWAERASYHPIETPSVEDSENSKDKETDPEETNYEKTSKGEIRPEKEQACEIEVAVAGHNERQAPDHANSKKTSLSGENNGLKEEMAHLAQEFQVLHANMDAVMEQNQKVMLQNAELVSLLKVAGVKGANVLK